MKSPSAHPAFWYHHWLSVSQPASPAAGNTTPTTSGSTACTDCLRGSARTWRSFHHPRLQHPGWPSPADMLPRPCASQCSTVSLRSCHSSPTSGLVSFVNRITPPLRSTLITSASTLLRAAPPLTPASVFLLILTYGVCHLSFPFPSGARFSRSIPKPVLSSCRLYAGCRQVRKQVPS